MFGRDKASDFKPHYFQRRIRVFKEPRVPTIIISREAYTKMWLYVDIAPEEVGWVGTAKQLPNGDFSIEKVWLLKQHVTGVETTLTLDGWADMATELLSRDEEGLEDWDNLRFWGHSHVRMGTSPSGRDQRSMEELEESQHPWFIRGIFNKLGRIEFTVYLYDKGIVFEDAPWTVEGLPASAPDTQAEPNATGDLKHAPGADSTEQKLEAEDKEPTDTGSNDKGSNVQKTVGFTPKPPPQTRLFGSVRSNADPLYQADVTEDLRAEVQAEFDVKVKSRWSSHNRYEPTWEIPDEVEQPTALPSSVESAQPAAAPVEKAAAPVSPMVITTPAESSSSLPLVSVRTVPRVAPRATKKSLWIKLSELVELFQTPNH